MKKYNIWENLGIAKGNANELLEKLGEMFGNYCKLYPYDENKDFYLSFVEETFSKEIREEVFDYDKYLYNSLITRRMENLYGNDFYGVDVKSDLDKLNIDEDNYGHLFNLCFWYASNFLANSNDVCNDLKVRIAKFNKDRIEEIGRANDDMMEKPVLQNYDTRTRKDITLKSVHPETYNDEVIDCLVLDSQDKIDTYVKMLPVTAFVGGRNDIRYDIRFGLPSERVNTSKKALYSGKEFFIEEKEEIVPNYSIRGNNIVDVAPIIVESVNSPISQTEMMTAENFDYYYKLDEDCREFVSTLDFDLYVRVYDNLLIGDTLVLAGSYICLANLEDYNGKDLDVVPKEVFESSYKNISVKEYQKMMGHIKTLKKI